MRAFVRDEGEIECGIDGDEAGKHGQKFHVAWALYFCLRLDGVKQSDSTEKHNGDRTCQVDDVGGDQRGQIRQDMRCVRPHIHR